VTFLVAVAVGGTGVEVGGTSVAVAVRVGGIAVGVGGAGVGAGVDVGAGWQPTTRISATIKSRAVLFIAGLLSCFSSVRSRSHVSTAKGMTGNATARRPRPTRRAK